jgi:pimeloyl-ACP methyl ester carboxylesterase
MAQVRERRIAVGGIAAPVLESGPPEAREAVLFLHGNPGSSEDWRDLLSRAGEHGRAVAPDLPGYGRAAGPDGFAYTLRGYAAWIDAAAANLGIERAHLVVHDFGGGFGLALAARRPDLVASFVVMNAGPLPGYRWHRVARLYRTRGVGEALQAATTRRMLVKGLRDADPGLPVEHAERMARDYDRTTKRVVLRLYRSSDPEHLPYDAAAIAALDRPGLVLWGAKDPFIDPSFAQVARATFAPRARVVLLEDASHWLFLAQPERAAAEIVPFLAERLAPGG